MIPDPPAAEETILVNKHALTAIIQGALSRAMRRDDSAPVDPLYDPEGTKAPPLVADAASPPADLGEALVWAKLDELIDTYASRLDQIAQSLKDDCK